MKKYESTIQNTFPAVSQNINTDIVKKMFEDYNNGASPSDLSRTHENAMTYVENVQKESVRRVQEHKKNRDATRRGETPPPLLSDPWENLEGNQAKLKKLSPEDRKNLRKQKEVERIKNKIKEEQDKGNYKNQNFNSKTFKNYNDLSKKPKTKTEKEHLKKRRKQLETARNNRINRTENQARAELGMSPKGSNKESQRIIQDKQAKGEFQAKRTYDDSRLQAHEKFFMGDKENYHFSEHAHIASQKLFVGPMQPEKPSLQNIIKRIKEGPAGEFYNKLVTDMKNTMPHNARDATAATFHGATTKASTVSKLGKIFGGSEFHGVNTISGGTMDINYLSNMSEKDIKLWKNMHREETAKFVRQKGGNIDPFSFKTNEITSKQVEKAKEAVEHFKSIDTSKFSDDKLKAHNHEMGIHQRTIDDYKHSKEFRSDLKARNSLQIAEIDSRLSEIDTSYKNSVKNFFSRSKLEKSEIQGLKETRKELVQRNSRLDMNYDTDSVHQNKLEIPKGAKQLHPELEKERIALNKRLDEIKKDKKTFNPSGNVHAQFNDGSVTRALRVNSDKKEFPKAQRYDYMAPEKNSKPFTHSVVGGLDRIEHPLMSENAIKGRLSEINQIYNGTDPTLYKRNPIASSSKLGTPKHTKDSWAPKYGTTGYGLGFKNSLMASRREHAARALHYMNPFGTGGLSSMQAIRESFGFMHKNQQLQAKQAVGFAKIPHLLVPGLALGMTLSSMNDGDSASDIFTNLFSMGTSMHGWRTGSAIGAATTRKGSLGRIVATGVGGVAGLATGLVAGVAIAGSLGDMTSQDSHVRHVAKKISTKELYNTSMDSYQSLTARQASLQKLAKSGLNDRGLLLGNEAAVLKGAM